MEARRDADLREGVCWIVFGEWGKTPADHGGGFLGQITAAIDGVRQAAKDGHVRIWGKINRSGVYDVIDPDFWKDHRIEHLRLIYPAEEVESVTECDHLRPKGRYMDLRISRAEFEREWPKPPPATAKSSELDDYRSTTINVSSQNQHGGVTAGIVNYAAPRRRQLGDEAKRELKERIPLGAKVTVRSASDGDSYQLGEQISTFLVSLGHNVDRVYIAATAVPIPPGVNAGQTDETSWLIEIGPSG